MARHNEQPSQGTADQTGRGRLTGILFRRWMLAVGIVVAIPAVWGLLQIADPESPQMTGALSVQSRSSAISQSISGAAWLESADVVVQGRVASTRFIPSEGLGYGTGGCYAIRLRIVESYPPLKKRTVEILAPGPRALDGGGEYVLALTWAGDRLVHRWSFGTREREIWTSPSGEVVRNLPSSRSETRLDEAWDWIRQVYDQTHFDSPQDPAEIGALAETLYNGSWTEANEALGVLTAYPAGVLDEEVLFELLTYRYAALLEERQPVRAEGPLVGVPYESVSGFRGFARTLLSMLLPLASEATTLEVIAFYEQDMSTADCQVFEENDFEDIILSYALKYPGPDREARVLGLLGRAYEVARPHGPQRPPVMIPDYLILERLAKTPGDDMDAIIDVVHSDPGRSHLHFESDERREQHRKDILATRAAALRAQQPYTPEALAERIKYERDERKYLTLHTFLRVPAGDSTWASQFIGFEAHEVARVALWKNPDPAFVSILREGLMTETQDIYPMLGALVACGDEETAFQFARDALDQPLSDENAGAHYGALRFLGACGDDSDIGRLRQYATTDSANITALLARTRIGDRSTVREWRAMYNGKDQGRRVTAAVALYCLGDETGAALIDLFRENAEASDPGYLARFGAMGATAEFQRAIAYLRSPALDGLFLERIGHRIEPGDYDLLRDPAFLAEHAGTVTPMLMDHLDARDRFTRIHARRTLEDITGVEVEWKDTGTVNENLEAAARLRAVGDAFLQVWEPVKTSAS